MERHTTVDGRTVRYLEVGAGHPLVLIHGFPLAASLWGPQLQACPLGWRILAPDLRGFGGSSRQALGPGGTVPTPAGSLDDYASDVIGLLDATKVDRAVVGGLSMGGYIAFAVFRRAPERVRALILADTRAEADSPESLAGREAMLAQLERHGTAAVAEALLPRILGPVARSERTDLVAEVKRVIEGANREAVADAIRALMSRPDSTSLLPTMQVPVHLLVGRDDALTPVELHEQMQRLLPNASLSILERSGHLSNLEQPDAFNRSITRFLESLP